MWKVHKNPKQIEVLVMGKKRTITVELIAYCKTYSDYTHFFMEDGNGDPLLVSGNLTESENLIDSDTFDRIHQSFLLNHKFFSGVCHNKNAKVAMLTKFGPLPFSQEGFKDWTKKYGKPSYLKNPGYVE